MNEMVVFVTAPTREIARTIGRALVEQKLAACANITLPVESIYSWQGQVQQEEEVLIILKTRADIFDRLTATVISLHPYDVPEIIALPIERGLPAYLNWIGEVTQA
jgi:periplasmic divalent cation tolerance protein